MRLLVINPNITESVSALIRAEAERSASPGTHITMLTAPFGVASAVDEATARPFDAVLVDFRLNDGNSAVDVLARLEAARPGLRARSVVITGSLRRELPDELPPVLLKPFSRAELEAALEQRLRSLGS